MGGVGQRLGLTLVIGSAGPAQHDPAPARHGPRSGPADARPDARLGLPFAARAFQGFGGGGIQALAFAILGEILPPRERGRYIGYFTIGFAGAGLAGPLVGGFVIERWTWPWIFLVNVPLAGAVTVVTGRALRLPFVSRRTRIDWLGAALFAVGLGSLIVALELGRTGWRRVPVVGLDGVSLVAVAAFLLQERRAPEPMIPLRRFRTRALLVACMLGMLAGWVSYGTASYLPLYFQDALFVKPTLSGLRLVPQLVGVVVMSFAAGRLIARTGRYRIYPIVGAVVGTLGLVGIAQIDGGTHYLPLVVPLRAKAGITDALPRRRARADGP